MTKNLRGGIRHVKGTHLAAGITTQKLAEATIIDLA
jgi:hypothetical protein